MSDYKRHGGHTKSMVGGGRLLPSSYTWREKKICVSLRSAMKNNSRICLTVGERGGENTRGKNINLKTTRLPFPRTYTIASQLGILSSNSLLRPNPWPPWGKRILNDLVFTIPWNEVRWACKVPIFNFLVLSRAIPSYSSSATSFHPYFPLVLLANHEILNKWGFHTSTPLVIPHSHPPASPVFQLLRGLQNLVHFLPPPRSLFWIFPLFYLTQGTYSLYHWPHSYSPKDVSSIILSSQLNCKLLSRRTRCVMCVHVCIC